jgi:hypothetical protein
MRKVPQVHELGDDGGGGQKIHASKRYECLDHRERAPSLYFLPQSDFDPLSALSTNLYRESVLGESDMVSGVPELDLRQEELMYWAPATTAVQVILAQPEGTQPESGPLLVSQCVFPRALQVADRLIFRFWDDNRRQFYGTM